MAMPLLGPPGPAGARRGPPRGLGRRTAVFQTFLRSQPVRHWRPQPTPPLLRSWARLPPQPPHPPPPPPPPLRRGYARTAPWAATFHPSPRLAGAGLDGARGGGAARVRRVRPGGTLPLGSGPGLPSPPDGTCSPGLTTTTMTTTMTTTTTAMATIMRPTPVEPPQTTTTAAEAVTTMAGVLPTASGRGARPPPGTRPTTVAGARLATVATGRPGAPRDGVNRPTGGHPDQGHPRRRSGV